MTEHANMVDIRNRVIERRLADLLDGGVPKDRIEIKIFPDGETRISVLGEEKYSYRWTSIDDALKIRFEETTI